MDLISQFKSTLIVDLAEVEEEMYGFLWQNIARGSSLFHPLLDHFASTSLSGCGAFGTVWLLKCLGSLCCAPARQRVVAPNIGVAWDDFSCFALYRSPCDDVSLNPLTRARRVVNCARRVLAPSNIAF